MREWADNPTHILVSPDRLVDVTGGELVQLLVVAKDDDGDIDGAEDGQLVGLFEKTALALEEGAAGAAGQWLRVKAALQGGRVRTQSGSCRP